MFFGERMKWKKFGIRLKHGIIIGIDSAVSRRLDVLEPFFGRQFTFKQKTMNPSKTCRIKQLEIGPMQNYIYLVGDPVSRQAAVVDPAWDVGTIVAEARRDDWQIACILLTHGHPDHTEGVSELQAAYPVPVYLSRDEPDLLTPTCRDLRRTVPGQNIAVGRLEITCLPTPGHSPGSQCYLCDPVLLTGDTLFIRGCGRCDLPGGDARALYHSLYDSQS